MTRPAPAGFAFDAFGTLFDYAAATPVLEGIEPAGELRRRAR
jgi:hypothetical protein